ncbi:Heterokaryon incompatibility protein 6,OR allele [Lachnellula hyalina]|uniref:Heterokaryon incompatibility protein 6,OR allele n=1 Tax=Lachnellula hyalina TaxID=1316788 RepID=A0A8H8TZH9_9HELO|nr:Heterokaryon incompatibility protein 6,OR allele [Lachnellula hyalina]TVY25852.1 Heterokaryon incompatibility protein 6,OR allele [Lachnellula hyalina]
MSFFVYRSLTPNKRRIRLIQVLPEVYRPSSKQSFNSPLNDIITNSLVCCTIAHVSLDDPPPYNALSYNWGDQTRRSEILLDGARISVTANLETALRHLRLQDKPLTLWIDALCIDQEDDVEKSEQIDQMRQIYARAFSVTIWLGPAADDSDVAMRWIQRYGGQALELGIGSRPELQLRHLLKTVDSPRAAPIDEKTLEFVADLKIQLSQNGAEQLKRIKALDLLFRRPYWSRVWVVQELISASEAHFICGLEKVAEEACHHALRLLRNYRRYQILRFGQNKSPQDPLWTSLVSLDTHDPIALLKFRRAASPFPLVYLLRSLRKFGATDPRDKVFALLGIASDAKALGLHCDYKKSCEDVYCEVARALIQNGHYDILSLGNLSKGSVGLPSWSPDWSIKSLRRPLQERSLDRSALPLTAILEPPFSASGTHRALELSVGSEGVGRMPLFLQGAVLSTVGQLGTVWGAEGVGVWLHDLDRLCSVAKDDTTEGRQKSVWRTAVADQEIRQGKTKPRFSKEKLSSVHEALKDKDLRLTRVQTLIESGLGDYYEQLQVVAAGRRPLSISSGYYGIGPHETREGDVFVIFLGAQVPYILRRCNKGNNYRLVGEAYVHGIMDGEAMKDFPATEMISLV